MCFRKESLQQEVLSYAKEEESQSNKEFGESGCTRARARTHTHTCCFFSPSGHNIVSWVEPLQ